MKEKNVTSKRLSKSQALLELGVFGSLLIMLLGVLVSYGLRYNFQQETTMNAFRRALAAAYNTPNDDYPYSVSIVERDYRHIPDPSNPFGVGGISPSVAGYTVTRNYKLNETPDDYQELSEVKYVINGKTVTAPGGENGFKTSGFVGGIDDIEEERYALAFGGSNIDKDNNRLISSTAGNIFSYDAAKQICLILIDNDICRRTCEEGGGEECSETCGKEVKYLPSFCQNYTVSSEGANTVYTFPRLDKLGAFAQAGKENGRSLGIQNDYREESVANSLTKNETKSYIVTTDNVEWEVISSIPIYYLPMNNGGSEGVEGVMQQEVRNSVSQSKRETWRTPF